MRTPGARTLLRVALVVAAVAAVTTAGVAAAAPQAQPAAPLPTASVVKALLDARTAASMPAEIADYGIEGGVVDIRLAGPAGPGLAALLAGIDPALVRVHTGAAAPRHEALAGGQRITGSGTRCTLGFTAHRGAENWIITAGHCTREADSWRDSDGDRIGSGARTAGNNVDVGAVPVTSGEAVLPQAGGQTVHGAVPAPVGSAVCLYGGTSGKRCGEITGRDRTVNFDGQQQTGMAVTSICSAPGDSGGPYLTPDGQAQGVHSGGGDGPGCLAYFTPVDQALAALDLTLHTA